MRVGPRSQLKCYSPRILGHEIVGDVVAVSPDEGRWKVGDRVGGGWHGGHDQQCKHCQRGKFNLCFKADINGVTRNGGCECIRSLFLICYSQSRTDSEYCTLRSEAAVEIPKDFDPAEVAPLLCAGLTVFNSIRNMGVLAGETVAIQGLGGLGHLGLQYARKMGYRTVALSSSDKKRDFAMKLGATDYVDCSKQTSAEALQEMGGAALIVVTAPNPSLIPDLLKGLDNGGKLLVLAPGGDVAMDTVSAISRSLSVHGWNSGHQLDAQDTVRFSKINDVSCMTEKVPFTDANKAFQRVHDGEVRFRGVLTF